MRIFFSLLICVGTATLGACDPVFENKSPLVRNIEVPASDFGTRVYLESSPCLTPARTGTTSVAIPFAAAAGLFVPAVVNMISTVTESYLKAREAALTESHAAGTSGVLLSVAQAPNRQTDLGSATIAQCLTIVRGKFGAWPGDQAVEVRPNSKLTLDVLKRAGLVDYPDFYFTAHLSYLNAGATTTDGKTTTTPATVVFQPALLHFARTAAGRTAKDSKTINMLIVMDTKPIDIAALDKKTDMSKLTATIPLQFEKVKIGTELQESLLRNRSVRVPLQLTGTGTLNVSLNVGAYVEETELPTGFDKIIVAAYGGAKGDINKGLEDLLKQLLNK